ncbi:MAG: ABC transporter substrate-binding protein [Anaerolineaceae bacterium]|jgi:putative spermidine/putrescine transport system substrate-binding protein|nr:MAG: ABC transporter substrate-binding protein [Anaerolineaceae bacterium]
MKRIVFLLVVFTLLLAACAPASPLPSGEGQGEGSQPAATNPPVATDAPIVAGEFDLNNWDSVLATAKGQTINWYIWGGSDSINAYVDNFYGKALKERYGITLNRVPLADTADAVNQVLSEKQAGTDPGSVDLIWINGENFFTLKQADMLYKDWAQKIPNAKLVNWENPAINLDFGHPVDNQESPWSSAQFQFIHDSARTNKDELPHSYAELKDWACTHPGRFTYIDPSGSGGFLGVRFIKGALYEISGGAEQWQKFDQALWDQHSPALWAYLSDLEPCLWRNGETYPKDESELVNLFANSEVDLSMTNDITGAGRWISDGRMPETARAFVFDNYMIGDFNYVAIPLNAPNKAAALVLANLLLEPEFQAAQILPENGFGLGYAIDVTRVTDTSALSALETAASQLGDAATPASDLAKSLVGDSAAEYQGLLEQDWLTFVLQK